MREDDSITSYITHTVRVFRLNNNIMNKNSQNRNDGGFLLLSLVHFSSFVRVCASCVSSSHWRMKRPLSVAREEDKTATTILFLSSHFPLNLHIR